MNVFVGFVNDHSAAVNVGQECFQRINNLLAFVFWNNLLFCQHIHMGNSAQNIVAIELFIKINRAIKGIGQAVDVR